MRKLVIGVDIGGTRTKIGLVDLSTGKVLNSIISPTEKKSAERFEAIVGSAIEKLKTFSGDAPIEGIGFGAPSFVFENGTLDSTYGFIDFMEDYPLVEIVQTKFGLPCRADNDARIVALGEALYGEGRNYKRMLMLTLGTGLGLGFTENSKLTDVLPYAHMGGHITITQDDVQCYCGKTGCLESLVSATGIVDAAKRANWYEQNGTPINAEIIFNSANDEHSIAKPIVDEWLSYLKIGIDNYINIFAPDMIVLGGGVAKSLIKYLPFFESDNLLRPYKNYKVKFSTSSLQEDAGILGSAALFSS
jgi:glucokinase